VTLLALRLKTVGDHRLESTFCVWKLRMRNSDIKTPDKNKEWLGLNAEIEEEYQEKAWN